MIKFIFSVFFLFPAYLLMKIINPKYFKIECKWYIYNGIISGVDITDRFQFVRFKSDGNYIDLNSCHQWMINREKFSDGISKLEFGLMLTKDDKQKIISALFDFMNKISLKPTIILTKDQWYTSEWIDYLKPFLDQINNIEIATTSKFESIINKIESMFSKKPFGTVLIQRVASKLKCSSSFLPFCHREYCGHGLYYENGSFNLATVSDCTFYKILFTWTSEEEFISYFSQQSDFSCSGAEQDNDVFKVDDDWSLGNQTITEKNLRKFLDF